jgi:hypothetical protein
MGCLRLNDKQAGIILDRLVKTVSYMRLVRFLADSAGHPKPLEEGNGRLDKPFKLTNTSTAML